MAGKNLFEFLRNRTSIKSDSCLFPDLSINFRYDLFLSSDLVYHLYMSRRHGAESFQYSVQ